MATRGEVEWIKAVAKRARIDGRTVAAILDTHAVRASPMVASPRRLAIRDLSFHGNKNAVDCPKPIAFEWSGLSPGLWAIVSERNFRGKSSIIHIVQWMLRGRAPERLRDDVKSWIHGCSLRFSVDDVIYEVRAESLDPVIGTFNRVDLHEKAELANFHGDAEFEGVMSAFFLRELGLDVVAQHRQSNLAGERGTTVVHGWPALSTAMFVGTNYSVLLGDLPSASGMNVPLLRMYLGLPWVSTLAAAKAAHRALVQDLEARQHRKSAADAAREARCQQILEELETKRRERDDSSYDEEVRAAAEALQAELGLEQLKLTDAADQVRHTADGVQEAKTAYNADRRELQAQLDAVAAGAVFRALDPSCCPRCDSAVTEAKRKLEKESQACAVCGETLESDSSDALISQLQTRVAASEAARTKALNLYQKAADKLTTCEARTSSLTSEIGDLSRRLASYGKRQRLDVEVAILEARLSEASSHLGEDQGVANEDDIKVLKAAVEVAEAKVKEVQAPLLQEASEELVRYANRFGMTNLTAASLKGNAQLRITTGGIETTYSRCTEGEKLRLKVATVLAMIRVAELRGVGRHPGLLMIDSPGAQEVAREDLDSLISGLEEAAKEFRHLQVFVASLGSEAVRQHVPAGRLRMARGDAYLW